MLYDEVDQICEYIRTHKPREKEFETINAAVRAINSDWYACRERNLVNIADEALIPIEEANEFAGIKGRGFAMGFPPKDIERIKAAVAYAYAHKYQMDNLNNVEKLKQMKEELLEAEEFVNNSINDNYKNKLY